MIYLFVEIHLCGGDLKMPAHKLLMTNFSLACGKMRLVRRMYWVFLNKQIKINVIFMQFKQLVFVLHYVIILLYFLRKR